LWLTLNPLEQHRSRQHRAHNSETLRLASPWQEKDNWSEFDLGRNAVSFDQTQDQQVGVTPGVDFHLWRPREHTESQGHRDHHSGIAMSHGISNPHTVLVGHTPISHSQTSLQRERQAQQEAERLIIVYLITWSKRNCFKNGIRLNLNQKNI
jgi:hypothetical protein